MAKVEIEERAFNEPRLRAASAKYRISAAIIIGYATQLWRYSQQIGVTKATKEEIISWLDCDRYSKPEAAFKWLLAAEFISSLAQENDENSMRDEKNLFEIRGNQLQTVKSAARIEKARHAAKSRIHKTFKNPEHATSKIQACLEHATSMPYKETSIQGDNYTLVDVAKFSPADLGKLWNQFRSPQQPAIKLTSLKSGSPRYRHAAARIAEEPTPAYWETAIKKIAASKFCNGISESNWIANFDWLLKPGRHDRISEGAYDNRGQETKTKFVSEDDIA